MSEEKTSQMNINIGKRVRCYLIFFAILILFLIWSKELVGLLRTTVDGDQDKSEMVKNLISTIVTLIGAIALLLLNFGRDIDLHNWLDRKIFHMRSKTEEIICEQMIKAAQSVGATGRENMNKNDRKKDVMYLFYHFVNEQVVLRDLAFTYWEQYFVNIYIIVFGTLGFICSSIIVMIQHKWQFTCLIPLVFVFIMLAIGLRTKYSLVKRIYGLPEQQIEEIRSSKAEELKREVEARFGGTILS